MPPAPAPAEDAQMSESAPTGGEAPSPAPISDAAAEAASRRAASAAEAKAKASERAEQLEATSARQKEVLSQLDGADKEQKRALLREMRILTAEAEKLLREAKEAAAAPSGPEDARARLERLRKEVRSISAPLDCVEGTQKLTARWLRRRARSACPVRVARLTERLDLTRARSETRNASGSICEASGSSLNR